MNKVRSAMVLFSTALLIGGVSYILGPVDLLADEEPPITVCDIADLLTCPTACDSQLDTVTCNSPYVYWKLIEAGEKYTCERCIYFENCSITPCSQN